MHRLGCTGFFLSGTLLEFRMFFCIIEEESTQDNTQDNSYTGNVFMENSHNEPKYIEVRGACVHNLKNVNVNVPVSDCRDCRRIRLRKIVVSTWRVVCRRLQTVSGVAFDLHQKAHDQSGKSTGRRSAVCPGGACISVRAFRASAARLKREPNC